MPASSIDAVALDGGEFLMGTEGPWAYPGDGEGPVHAVTLSPFAMDATAVTNAAFGAFIDATGYVTDGERYGWSFVFAGLLPDDFEETQAVVREGHTYTHRVQELLRQVGLA